METGDLLSKEELSAIKGGEWIYDEETDEWYWKTILFCCIHFHFG